MTSADAFTLAVEAFLERLRLQQPIAILQYGSSLRPQDFMPGQSDLDLLVISDEPLEDVHNELGYRYSFVSPRDFVSGLTSGDMVWLSALHSGQVRHDPRGFLRSVRALVDSGLDVRPNLVTLRSCVGVIGNHLGMAMELYFSRGGSDPEPILRRLYSAAKGIGSYLALASTHANPHGFSAVLGALEPFPEAAALLRRTREQLLSSAVSSHEPRPRTHVEDAGVGHLILEVERVYLREIGLLPGRRSLHSLVDEYQHRHGALTRTCLVRMDNVRGTLSVVGESAEGYCLFGLTDARQPRGTFFRQVFADREELENTLGPVVSHP